MIESQPTIWAEFTVRTESLDPDEATSKLALSPSKTWKRGDRAYRRGSDKRWSDSGWQIRTPQAVGMDLSRHVGDVVELLLPRRQAVWDLPEAGNLAYIEAVVNLTTELLMPEMVFPSALLRRIGELGLDLSFDVLPHVET